MAKFNLSLDDLSPHPRAGLDFESIKWCDKLIESYPTVKINLFIPAAYCRLGEEPCNLTNHKDWVKKLRGLSDNYRFNYHGYHHRRISKKYGNSNNDEWQYSDSNHAYQLITNMVKEFKRSGLWDDKKFKETFRPPGWKISKDAVHSLEEYGWITCFAGSQEYYEKVKDVLKVKWVNYNWDLLTEPPKEGNIVAYGHTSNWTTNFMNEERYNTIMKFLQDKQFEFVFIEDM